VLRRTTAPRNVGAYMNVAIALLCCTANLMLLAIPLVGLMFLPSLLGSVCWAGAALRATTFID
jgi:hypothetical protein